MEDIFSVKSRHGHYHNKGFYWMDYVLIDGKKTPVMVMFGADIIGDKTCYRIGNATEVWFEANSMVRDVIVEKGRQLIKEKLKNKKVQALNEKPYDWK
ncbi:MAG: hypothetical protein A2293_11135 [Elusimicrobia bacterium RIFOXYB2_FULL_49_7]|nr:MAG: hypothetical protein A2293_11135 [Elusimicrobia bacterium RIFOXYB2_FULL_49_7]